LKIEETKGQEKNYHGTTVNSSLRWNVGIYGLPSPTRVPCRGHSFRLVTKTLLQLDRCGKICRSNFDICNKV